MNSNASISSLSSVAIKLLQKLIAIPSFSREENNTADFLESIFTERNIPVNRIQNNVWVSNKYFDALKQSLLLNSHHDTVPPNKGYIADPYEAIIQNGKLFGLGSNDAGGALVSLLSTFLHFYESQLPFNLIFAASAEEEVSGNNGMELLLQHLPKIDMAIVGEPTQMNMAVAEKGLMVLDCVATGHSGHAARDEGDNALYKAVTDIEFLRNFSFEKSSSLLGPIHVATTSIETKNKSHNVVPDECSFIVDVRVNEQYSFEEILNTLKENMQSEIRPRSLRLKPSFIEYGHPLVRAGLTCGMQTYGSPTLSDMALMNFPAIKLGPGDSARSHTADEFIFVNEIHEGIGKYIELIDHLSELIKTG